MFLVTACNRLTTLLSPCASAVRLLMLTVACGCANYCAATARVIRTREAGLSRYSWIASHQPSKVLELGDELGVLPRLGLKVFVVCAIWNPRFT